MRPAAATVEDAAIVNILYSFVFKFFFLWRSFSCFCSSTSRSTQTDIISFFLGAKIKKNQRLTSIKKLSPSCAFSQSEEKNSRTSRKEGKKRLTRRLKRHLLSHIYSFTHQNVSSAQLIQSVNQCLGGASLFPFIIFFSSFLLGVVDFFSPGKKACSIRVTYALMCESRERR